MREARTDIILLVGDCESSTVDILDKLYAAGFSVVGPVANASMALAMAAQTAPTIALVVSPPTGRRKASELAGDLMRTWGIRSWILDQAADMPEVDYAVWRASDERVSHIRRALESDSTAMDDSASHLAAA